MFPKFECAVSQTDFMHPRKQRLFPENQGLLPKKHWMFTQKTQVWFVLLPYLSLLFCESLYLKQIVLLDACEFLKFKQFVACFAIYDGSREGFHTSGHADVNTLEDVCALVNPSIGVIPGFALKFALKNVYELWCLYLKALTKRLSCGSYGFSS